MPAPGDLAQQSSFSIYIDYDTEAQGASRVFRAMASMIEAVQNLDRDLAATVRSDLQVVSQLKDVEASSLKALVESLTRYVDGEPQTEQGLTRASEFIERAREQIIDYVGGHSTVETRDDVKELRRAISIIAEDTGVDQVLTYATPPPRVLLERMQELGQATQELAPTDRLEYASARKLVPVNERFTIGAGRIEELITERTEEGVVNIVLVVKKPDYLGTSMWQFKFDSKLVEAKISDADWLSRFHAREIELQPGDGIHAEVGAIIRKDQEGRIVSEKYTVQRVLGVVRASELAQSVLPLEDVA